LADPTQSFSRENLYELVWAKPATQIARELSITPALVIKACKLLNVPRPTTGHWVKLEHGQTPSRPMLPPVEPGAMVTVMLEKLRRHPKVEKSETPPLPVPAPAEEESIKWHFAVRKTKAALRGGIVDDKYGTIIPKRDHHHLNISVTRTSIDRALLLLNQLVWRLEELGFTLKAPQQGESLFSLIYGPTDTELTFLLKEEVERYERELKPEEKNKDPLFIWNRWLHRPTGRLRLLINEYHPAGAQKSWGDGKNTKIEDKLVDAAPGFVLCAQGKHAQHLEWAERQRRWDEEARQRREAEERKRKEDERRATLLTAAKNWSNATTLRAFRAACEARFKSVSQRGTLTQLQGDWLAWVDLVIEESDPLTSGFLKRLEE
jgi:hypothetical protein